MKHFGVIGLGNFGGTLAVELHELGNKVMAIDADEERAQVFRDLLPHVVVADATDREALETLGIAAVDCVIISMGRQLEASVLITLHCVELGVPCVYAKVVSHSHGRILEKVGANKVIFPEREVATRLAHKLSMPNLVDYLPIGKGYSVDQIQTPKQFAGKTLRELEVTTRFNVQVLAVRQSAAADSPLEVPTADTELHGGEQLVLMGRNEDLDKIGEMD